jgi:uncharacterized protein YjbJ (UPF0337 family)
MGGHGLAPATRLIAHPLTQGRNARGRDPLFLCEAPPPDGVQEKDDPMPDHDRVEGAARNLGGKAKEAAGKVTGDEKLKAEGRADQVEGKVQNAVGGLKDILRGDNRN